MNNKNGNGRSLPLLIIAALGVVFGDIGTSPLYALKLSVEATQESGAGITASVLGVLSLITCALIIFILFNRFSLSFKSTLSILI